MKNMQNPGMHSSNYRQRYINRSLQRHLSSFQENNLEALMADYTSESVLITPDTSYTGLEEIKDYFVDLISHFPKQKSSIELDKTVINDDLVYIVWHGKSPSLDSSLCNRYFHH